MALDGIMFEGVAVRVRRPNDYNPAAAALLGPGNPSPTLNLAAIGLGAGGGGGGGGGGGAGQVRRCGSLCFSLVCCCLLLCCLWKRMPQHMLCAGAWL
jgi:hypothetical protein